MTFSGKAYDSPCFATPLLFLKLSQLTNAPGASCTTFEEVKKNETLGMRWRFLYQSAVNAWDKLDFGEEKYRRIKARVDDTDADLSDTDVGLSSSSSDDGWDEEMEGEEKGKGKGKAAA
jgi:hypothetical protein